MLALILFILFLITYYTPGFEIKIRVGNKQFVLRVGNTDNNEYNSSESERPVEEIIISSSHLSGAFDFNINGTLNNNV